MSDTIWMNALRATAVFGVVIHHFLLFIPYEHSNGGFASVATIIQDSGGTCVHLFFMLSGCGLVISYSKQSSFDYSGWAKRRFGKIVLPYWVIVSCTFVLANLAHKVWATSADSYSWPAFFSYILFARNHYNPSWGMNPTLWFMPVIIGLYIAFPLLVHLLREQGVTRFLVFSTLVTYGSIFCFRLLGYRGFCFYLFSYFITRTFEAGGLYNDVFTAGAVFLITLNIWNLLLRNAGKGVASFIDEVSRVSYVMYLIHGALIIYLILPFLDKTKALPLDPLLSLILCSIFFLLVFTLARLIYQPVMAIANTRKYI